MNDNAIIELDARLGRIFSGFFVKRALDEQGAMSSVFEGESEALSALRAVIKFFKPGVSSQARFEREARLMALLSDHASFPTIYCFDYDDEGTPYIVMELLEGSSLRTFLNRKGRLELVDTLTVMGQLLDGLAAAGKKKVLWLDLKPENIFVLGHDGVESIKLLDFGIGRLEGDLRLTAADTALGTPSYMAPEILSSRSSRPADHRADLYGATVLLYTLLAGCEPFVAIEGQNPMISVANQHLYEPVPPLPNDLDLTPKQRSFLDDFIRRGMAKRREERFDDASSMREVLFSVLSTTGSPPPDGPPVQHNKRWSPALVGLGLAASSATLLLVVLFIGVALHLNEPKAITEMDLDKSATAEVLDQVQAIEQLDRPQEPDDVEPPSFMIFEPESVEPESVEPPAKIKEAEVPKKLERTDTSKKASTTFDPF